MLGPAYPGAPDSGNVQDIIYKLSLLASAMVSPQFLLSFSNTDEGSESAVDSIL